MHLTLHKCPFRRKYIARDLSNEVVNLKSPYCASIEEEFLDCIGEECMKFTYPDKCGNQ
jgi:hypothetical protein